MPTSKHETKYDDTSPAGDESARVREAVIDLPLIATSDELPDHPEPSFEQILAHARLLLSWRKSDYFEERRALMQSERFVMD